MVLAILRHRRATFREADKRVAARSLTKWKISPAPPPNGKVRRFAALFAAALSGLAFGSLAAQPGGLAPASAPHADGNPLSGPARWLKAELGDRRVTLDIDAALYDQWASRTAVGDNNLATFAWQATGTWRLLHNDRWGTGSIGWTLLGSPGLNYKTSEETMSGNVGSISGLNANVFPNAAAVDELFWKHVFADKHWTLLAGRVDQSFYFDTNRVANDAYSQFVAFAFENNLSIPWSTYGDFGGLVRFDPHPDLYLMASVAGAGNDQPRVFRESGARGAWNQLVEIGITRHLPGLGRGHYRLTPWHNSAAGQGGFGIAFNFDQELGDRGRGDRRSGSGKSVGFLRAGIGDGDVTPVERFLSGGISVHGPFGRDRDEMALGIAWSDPSPTDGERSETLVETYYRYALSRSLTLTPDVQIVINPANNDEASTIVVLGVRLHLKL